MAWAEFDSPNLTWAEFGGSSQTWSTDKIDAVTSQKAGLCDHLRPSVVCFLFVCKQDNSKTNGPISMKFGNMTDNDIGKSQLDFGHDAEELFSVSIA